MKKYIFVFLTLLFLLNITPVFALQDGFKKAEEGDIEYKAEVTIPGFPEEKIKVESTTLGLYIKILYQYLLYAAGVLATIVVMVGGFQWIVAGGNQSKIGEAKGRIVGAIVGLFLAMGSYLLLVTINPDLVKIVDLSMPSIVPISFYCQEGQTVSVVSFDAIKWESMGHVEYEATNHKNGVDGTKAFCGFKYKYTIGENNFECTGTKCSSNTKTCYKDECLEPAIALCKGKSTKDSCGGGNGLISGYKNGWCDQFGKCILCFEAGANCNGAAYKCPGPSGACGKGTGDNCDRGICIEY